MPPPKEVHPIRLDPEVVQEVDRIAASEGRTRSDVIRRLIDEALQARKLNR